MSEQNVEIVRQLIGVFRSRDQSDAAGFSDGDMTAAAELIDPEIEWDATRVPVEDIRGMYHGYLGVAGFWKAWLEAWDTVEIDDDPELIDAGDHVFVWIEHTKLRGKGSGVEVDFPAYAWVITFRDRKVRRVAMYMDRASALKAAGLSE